MIHFITQYNSNDTRSYIVQIKVGLSPISALNKRKTGQGATGKIFPLAPAGESLIVPAPLAQISAGMSPIVQTPLAQLLGYHHLALLDKLGSPADRLWYAGKAVELTGGAMCWHPALIPQYYQT